MSERRTVARILHDVGLAAWFGGSLMGAVGVNGAAADVDDPRERARVANAGWARWTPINLLAIVAHLAGAARIARADKRGLVGGPASPLKTVLTAGALGATAYARLLGEELMRAGDVSISFGIRPSETTRGKLATARRHLATLQWAIPGLTGAILAISAFARESQRGVNQAQPTSVTQAPGAAPIRPPASGTARPGTARQRTRRR